MTNQKIACPCYVRACNVFDNNICIAHLYEVRNDAGEKNWCIEPVWEVLDKQEDPYVTGVDLRLHKDIYVRDGVPAIITERCWDRRRPDIRYLLDYVGLINYDEYEIVCRMHGYCVNNPYTVERSFECKFKELEGTKLWNLYQ